jgi:predicted acetyltransferase
MSSAPDSALPAPSGPLQWGEVSLKFVEVVPGNPQRGLAPFYHFHIIAAETEVGFINLRVGNSEHVQMFAGHIGYTVEEPFRGRGYARQACHALAPFVRSIYPAVIITCDPDNYASIRTIEKLGAQFVEEVAVPARDPMYDRGARIKRRYRWVP